MDAAGDHKGKVERVVEEAVRMHLDASREGEADNDRMSGIEVAIARKIKQDLENTYKGNWNVILGESFATTLGLAATVPYAHIQANKYNILIFQRNQ